MNVQELEAFATEMSVVVREVVAEATAPLVTRIAELEQRQSDGQAELKRELVTLAASTDEQITITRSQEPKEFDPEPVRQIAQEIVASAVAALPVPETPTVELPDIGKMVSEAVAAIPAPQNGKDADPEQTRMMVREEVEGVLAGWEKPKNGEPGKDGLSISDLFVAEGGELIAMLPDGRSKNLGKFRGKDGEPGKDGKDADIYAPDDVAENVSIAVKMLSLIPNTKEASPAGNFNINLPPLNLKMPDMSVKVDVPEQKAPIVTVEPTTVNVDAPVVNVSVPEPKLKKTETTVTKHDARGRIEKFTQQEVEA